MVEPINERISKELGVRSEQVDAAVALLDEEATVPFIARYRKEATGGLDDTQLRQLEERLRYLRQFEERRAVILQSIREQEKLTPELEKEINDAETKTRLEDLYLPFRPKRRTKAQMAREAGLEPLADALSRDPTQSPEECAAAYVDAEKGIAGADAALEGAQQILMERFSEDAHVIGELRDWVWKKGKLTARVVKGKEESGAKFSDYFEFSEPLRRIPSHRALALFRGRDSGVLRLSLLVEPDESGKETREGGRGERSVCSRFGIHPRGRTADDWLVETARRAWREKILVHLETELVSRVKEAAEKEAIRVFAANLRDLLLAAPAGPRVTVGLDPGLRTGVKIAVINGTGKLVEHGTIFPHAPRKKWDESIESLVEICGKQQVALVAIGNGTASRDTDKLVAQMINENPDRGLAKLVVSEAGASVYSASELAAKEFPDLDVSFRGAVSIARRLQDPLAELVKIEPRSIGVGQYQHDVDQGALARSLDAVVEDCVNAVGVDVNTASASLLARVSGLNRAHAEKIVDHRDKHGAFDVRTALLEVPRFGAKTYQLAAGFLRVRDGSNPLDRSAVHPEAYPVVEKLLEKTGLPVDQVIGDKALLSGVDPGALTDAIFGLPTVTDILRELEKPGRDPRPEFKTATFKDGVEKPEDLELGMVLEGVVTNVTNFGAFIDVGVHQDGLVHVSALSNRFVRDPREIAKAGDVVKVKVMELDLKRKRIGLSMRLDDKPGEKPQPKWKPRAAAGSGDRRGRGAQRRRAPRDREAGAKGDGPGSGGRRPPSQRPAAEGRSGGHRDTPRRAAGGGRSKDSRDSRDSRRKPSRSSEDPRPTVKGRPTTMSRLLDEALAKAKSQEQSDEKKS